MRYPFNVRRVIIFVLLAIFLISYCGCARPLGKSINNSKELAAYLPVLREDYPQIKESLEILRLGTFDEEGYAIYNRSNASYSRDYQVALSDGKQYYNFEECLDLFPQEEIDAINDLLFSDELQLNAISIHSTEGVLSSGAMFIYAFEVIHPFADGNGRIGRLWHTLLLLKWNPVSAWLPVETMIHNRQQEYYEAINTSNNAADGTIFVEFMLTAIKASLIEAISMSDEMSDAPMNKQASRQSIIEAFLKQYPSIMNADVRALCGVSSATANRILAGLVADGVLEKHHEGGHWACRLTV